MRASTEAGDTFGIYNYYHFKIIVCGGEILTLTNTMEYRQQWPQVEEGKIFKVALSEYEDWFEIEPLNDNSRLCMTSYYLREESCTNNYQSSQIHIDGQQDIIVDLSKPFLKQKICLYSESKGHQAVHKIIDFEICDAKIQTFSKQVTVTFLIDGSTDPKEILEEQLKSYFDVRSDYCVITHFELLQSATTEANIDLYSPTNFQKHKAEKFIKYNEKEKIITIRQNDKILKGMQKGQVLNVLKYVKAITAQSHYSMQPIIFKFIKSYNMLPYFIGTKKLEDWVITVEQEQILKGNADPFILYLPGFKDDESNTVKLDFNEQLMQEWIKLNKDEGEGMYSLVIDPVKVTYKDEGTYLFNILLSDNVSPGVFNTYPLKVQLTYVQFAYANIVQQETAMKEDSSKKFEQKKIQFDGSVPSPKVRIGNFTVDHKLSLVFDQKMNVNKSLDFSKVLQFKTINGLSGKETTGKYLGNYRILSENDVLGPNQNFEWEVYVHEPKLIIFRVYYEDIQQVSTVSKDQMVITVLDLSQLRSEGTMAPLSSSSIVSSQQCGNVQNSMCQSIPPYLKEDTKKQIDSATQILKGSISALIQANIFLMIPLGKSLSSLWDIIRPLQYLSIIALIQVLYPSELYVFFVNMIDMASLDLFFGLQITEFLFQFDSGTEPLNSHFEEFGVDSTVYLLNSSSIIIPIVPLIILEYILLKMMKKLIKYNFEQPYLRKLGMYIGLLDQDIFGNLSKLLLEGSFDLTFCTLINLYTILNSETLSELMLNFTSGSDIINSTITLVSFFVVVLFMPSYTILTAYRFFNSNSLTAEQNFAIIQSPLFAENSRQSFLGMINEALFMIRRTITIAMIVFCPYPIFQIQVIIQMSIWTSMYLMQFKPIDNIRLQIINEITITLVCYGFYILIDISGTYYGKQFVGKAVIGFISANVVYNVVRVALITSMQVYYSAKVFYKSTMKSRKGQQIFKDFKVVTKEFPGKFLVTEYLIEQNEAKLRSESWNTQQQWLDANGFEYSHLPEHEQFMIEIRKFKFCQNNEAIKINSQTRFVAKKLIIKDQLQQKIKPLEVIPEAKDNKFDQKWSIVQTKKLAPIKEQRESTDGQGDDSEEEQPQILKNLRNLVRFPEKIYIIQDFELEIEKLKEVINSIQGQTINSKVLKALVRVQDHYLSLEEDNENVRKQSRQKDLRFLKELEENVTDKYNHYICLSDNEEHGFLRQQKIIQQVSSKNQTTQTKKINDSNKILIEQKKKIVNLFPGASIFGLKSSQSNVSSILCCIQILLSLKSVKDYYMKRLYAGHCPPISSLKIANFLKDLYRNACFLRLDPYSSQALEINLDQIFHLYSKDPLYFFYQFLQKSSEEMQKHKMSFDKFNSSSIRKHVMYEKKHNFSYLSKMFALQYQTKNFCGQCEEKTVTYSTEFGLNIKLSEKETTLTELLGINFSSYKFECECKCGAHVKHIERAITFFPQYLIVGLQRFDGYGNRRSVLENPVEVLLELDLSQCASKDLVQEKAEGKHLREFFDEGNTPHMQKLQKKIDMKVKQSNNKYELQAIICHNGTSMNTGQFYSYVKRSIPQSQEYQQQDSFEDDEQEKLVKLGGRADLFSKRRVKKTKLEPIFQDNAEESGKPATEQPAADQLENESDKEFPTERFKEPIDMKGFQVFAKPKSRKHLFKKIKGEQMEGGDPEPKPQTVEEWFLFIDDYHTKIDINEVLRKEKLNIYTVLYKAKS